MKAKIREIGLGLFVATLLSALFALYLSVDLTFTIPPFIIAVILMFIDDRYIDDIEKKFKLNPIKIDKDK